MPETFPPLQPPKRLLLGPGPSMVAPRVYEALAKPIVGHLDPYFFQVSDDIRKLLSWCSPRKTSSTSPFPAPARPAWRRPWRTWPKTARSSRSSSTAFSANASRRWRGGRMPRWCGSKSPGANVFDDDEARAFILRERPRVVAFVQAETSTGVFQPGKAICEAAHEVGALVIADCVTSLGGMPVMWTEPASTSPTVAPEGPELPARTGAGHGFPARPGAAAGPQRHRA